jgi:hypothetical protein
MKNRNDEDDGHDYTPNELAHLHQEKYEQIVQSNLEDGDTIKHWRQRNQEAADEFLRHQRQS